MNFLNDPQSVRRAATGVLWAAAGVAMLLAFGWFASRSGPLAPTRVTLAQVAEGTLEPSLFGIGVVEARRAYLIGPTTAGRVQRVLVDVGDHVRAGQLLAEMDPVDLDARLASSSAAVARAQSAVAAAQAQVRDAHSRLALAEGDAARYVDLGRQNFVSTSVVDAKLQLLHSARAQLAAVDSALAGAREDQARLEAEREAARQQRGNIRLQAPFDGVVTARIAEPGSTVVAGQAVVKLFDPSSLWVTSRLDQSRATGLGPGLRAQITLRSSSHAPVPGMVARIDPASDSITEERIAQVTFDSPPAGLSTGEMAEVLVRLPAVHGALLVSNAALRQRGTHTGVWVHQEGKLRFVSIDVGAEGDDGMVQVIRGLKAGDAVVIHSEAELGEDSRFRIVESLIGGPQ
jgi:HlyD family secretion protein